MATTQALATQVAQRVSMCEIMLAPNADLAATLVQLATSNAEKEKAAAIESRQELVMMYGMPNYTEKPFAFANGVAVIPIHGALINRFSHSWGFVTGYNFIQNQLRMALDDDDVKAIIFDCNSPGGEVTGLYETADEIFLSRGQKPLIAMVDTACYSACYALASSCDKIVVTPSGGAGSIGAMILHVSVSKMLEMDGVKVTPIFSGTHKVDGASYRDLPEDVKQRMQTLVDDSRKSFVELVSRNLGVDEKVIFDTEAACYRASEALELGLIHEIATPSQAAIALFNELNGSPEIEEDEMSLTEQQKSLLAAAGMPYVAASKETPAPAADTTQAAPAAAAPAAAAPAAAAAAAPSNDDAIKAERQRMLSITSSAEGQANVALAQHLAFNTNMSSEDAIATLKAAGPAVVAPAKTDAPANQNANAATFEQAMNGGDQPNVGADAENTTQQQNANAKPGSDLIAAYNMATGQKLGE